MSAQSPRQPTQVMAILNVTPDSFSDGGLLNSVSAALKAAEGALAAGADILDVGGESTRPGARPVAADEELRRVVPVIEGILKEFPRSKISVDTRKAAVAEASCQAGACIVNDVSGLQHDPAIAEVAARYQARLVIMHSQGTPETMQRNPAYPGGVIPEIHRFFERQVALATEMGVARQRLILDPGFGFGKTLAHNLDLLHGLDQFMDLSLPLLVGTSRKSFLTLGDSSIPPPAREALTAASLALAVERGASLVRVHDPVVQVPVVRWIDAALGSASPAMGSSAGLTG